MTVARRLSADLILVYLLYSVPLTTDPGHIPALLPLYASDSAYNPVRQLGLDASINLLNSHYKCEAAGRERRLFDG
jgi:hypothetical protein